MVQILGSLLFTGFFMLWTFCYGVLFFLASLCVPFRMRFTLAQVWARVVLWMLRFCCHLDFQIEGRENLPAGNHIALIKHSSSWETIAQTVLIPPHVWVLKRELTWIPVVGWGLKLLRAIAVNRGGGGRAVKQVLEQGQARLAEGLWIVFFPEGTRMPPGQTRRYGSSGALLAQQSGKLIVPVAHDAGYYWPRRGLIKRRGVIRVRIGPPITPGDRDPRSVNEEVQQWIEAHSRH